MTRREEVAESAHEEWDYSHVEGDFGQTFATSKPCCLQLQGEATQDTDAFHETLSDRGYSPIDVRPDRKHEEGKLHYDGEVCSDEHYSRVHILVFRDGQVRLFPNDDYVPTVDELEDLIAALETGFDAQLKHTPDE